MQYELIAEGIGQASPHHEEAALELAYEFLRRHYMDVEDAYKVYQIYQTDRSAEKAKLWSELETYANQVLYGEMHENSLITIEVETLESS
ncbi:hypothetical protein [Gilvimarinus japonicus]|uniref:Uncharacterized protein n=1 Tax=Gilvimarinus japonicus TaxID=1796469 RepID=A0ABV7HSZ6_9GAMM